MSLDLYQLPNSPTDFKSRSNDVFDKLLNLEKQHDNHTKTQPSIVIPDDSPSSSSQQNPTIPNHAIVFKKRSADEETFTRPTGKWQKYDLGDVNEHHLSNAGNRHALNDFFRARVKPTKEEPIVNDPVFKRPMKKETISNEDDEQQQYIPVRAPISTQSHTNKDNDEDDDQIGAYKLKSTQKKPRGVLSTNKKPVTKIPMEIPEDKSNEEDNDDDELNDELFEP